MSSTLRAVTGLSQRERTLGITALIALLLHSLALYGVHWTPLDTLQFAAREQGISINLASAPSPLTGQHAAEPIRQFLSAPHRQKESPVMEPASAVVSEPTPKITRPQQQWQQRAPTAVPNADKAVTSTETAQPMLPSNNEKGASHAATVDLKPLTSYSNPKPVYPELARRRRQEGLVQLLANVDEKGNLAQLTLLKSSGFTLLDEAALAAVRKWRFKPGYLGGKTTQGTLVVPIEFRLR